MNRSMISASFFPNCCKITAAIMSMCSSIYIYTMFGIIWSVTTTGYKIFFRILFWSKAANFTTLKIIQTDNEKKSKSNQNKQNLGQTMFDRLCKRLPINLIKRGISSFYNFQMLFVIKSREKRKCGFQNLIYSNFKPTVEDI